MNIFTYKSTNFGDGVNKLFWEKITKKNIICNLNNDHYISTGSIMFLVKQNSIIFGTGFISKEGDLGGGNWNSDKSKKCVQPKDVISVRGPLTREKLLKFNVKCPENYGDPLILFPCIYACSANEIKDKITVGIIPHYIDYNNNLRLLKESLESVGYKVNIINISVGENYKKLIDEIILCDYIISSSLHGVIMGLVYKKKTIFLEFSDKVIGGGFKFQDFFRSVDIKYNNINVYDYSSLNNIIDIDYDKLLNLGLRLISLIPFIDDDRKRDLTDTYREFYSQK